MPKTRRRPQTMPPPVPIMEILQPEDLKTALVASDVTLAEPLGPNVFKAATADLNAAFHRLVTAHNAPKLTNIDGTAKALREMSDGCSATLKPLAFRLQQMPQDPGLLNAFAGDLADTNDPMILALLDASAALDGHIASGDHLVLAFTMVRHLGRWAGAAATQFEAGAKAAEAGRQADLRQQSFVFGTFVFGAYTQLTGAAVKISRHPPDHSDAGKPTGPLLRFCQSIYEQLRHRCANMPDLAELVTVKELNPTDETIADWQRAFTQGTRRSQRA